MKFKIGCKDLLLGLVNTLLCLYSLSITASLGCFVYYLGIQEVFSKFAGWFMLFSGFITFIAFWKITESL